MTRHQRRRKAKELALAAKRQAIVQGNLAAPLQPKPSSLIAQGYAQATGIRLATICDKGLHRNNAVPRKHRTVAVICADKPNGEALYRLRVAPFYRDDMRVIAPKAK